MPKADFTIWDRKTLEEFARVCADENRHLREDLRAVHAAWRKCLLTPSTSDVSSGTSQPEITP